MEEGPLETIVRPVDVPNEIEPAVDHQVTESDVPDAFGSVMPTAPAGKVKESPTGTISKVGAAIVVGGSGGTDRPTRA